MKNKEKMVDRRVIRTKREIELALTTLLEQKSIEEITVREITELAGINRGTFYLHYVDKYDLLNKSMNKVIVEMNELGMPILAPVEQADQNVPEEVVTSFTNIFRYVEENDRLIRCLFSENSRSSFHLHFNEVIKESLIRKMQADNPKMPPRYLVTAVSYAYEGLIQAWLDSGMQETAEEMGQYGYDLIFHSMIELTQGIRIDK